MARDGSDWLDWTDEQLLDYEQRLYDQEVAGDDTWELRDEALWEISRRDIPKPPPTTQVGPDDPGPTFVRRVVDDGRQPDPVTGLPLETDREFRQRILDTMKNETRKEP